MSKKVYIGSGHGGSDPGAVANGFQEKDLNLSIALACYETLTRHGVTVKMSKTKDENDPYSETLPEVNRFAPDVAVEIHNNAGGGDGVEVYHSKRDSSDDALAKNILDAIVAIGQNSRGLKTKELSNGSAYFAWIRELNCPAVLVECAFMDTKDIQIVDTHAEQKAMGVAVAKGILKTLGIAYKEEVAKYAVQIGGFSSKAEADAVKQKLVGAGYKAVVVESANNVEVPAPKIGDIVNFAGGKHYTSANGDTGYAATAGSAKISNIIDGAKHPYHLIRVSGGGSNVYGWVNADTIK